MLARRSVTEVPIVEPRGTLPTDSIMTDFEMSAKSPLLEKRPAVTAGLERGLGLRLAEIMKFLDRAGVGQTKPGERLPNPRVELPKGYTL